MRDCLHNISELEGKLKKSESEKETRITTAMAGCKTQSILTKQICKLGG